MKNIWKLLMVAMMTIAMIGCPEETKEEEKTTTTPAAAGDNNLFAGTAAKEKMGQWGGSFTIILLKEDQWEDGFHPQNDGTVEDPCYQIKCTLVSGDNNIIFPKYGKAVGNAKAVSTDKADYVYKSVAASGMTATTEDAKGTATLVIDLDKIVADELYVMANGSENKASEIEGFEMPNWSEYTPYVVGMFDSTGDQDANTPGFTYAGIIGWDGGAKVHKVAKAAEGVSFPTTWGTFIPEPKFDSLDSEFYNQAGAAFTIQGGSAKGLTYPINIPFENGIAEDTFTFTDLTGWGGTTLHFWGGVYAGDDNTLVKTFAQLSFGTVVLGTAKEIEYGKDNFESEIGAGTYKIKVDLTGSEPTITVTEAEVTP